MEGRRRLAQPVKRPAAARAGKRAPARRPAVDLAVWRRAIATPFVRADRILHRWGTALTRVAPRRAGTVASVLLIAASAGYGVARGEHGPAIVAFLKDTRDAAGNAAGFRIASLAITGRRQLSEAEVLAAAGITARTSLLFLDVEDARQLLESTPWIAQATVRKLYPGQLEISIEERDPFALWQREGKLFIIAADGTVLGPMGDRRIAGLPLVVGPGAAPRARDFLALLERHPVIREQFRAAVLVAERRWNLKLKNGLDIRLPEAEVARALATLAALDRDKKLLSRDITAIDMRLPDRVTVRLSDEAAQAREQAEKDKKKRKGGNA